MRIRMAIPSANYIGLYSTGLRVIHVYTSFACAVHFVCMHWSYKAIATYWRMNAPALSEPWHTLYSGFLQPLGSCATIKARGSRRCNKLCFQAGQPFSGEYRVLPQLVVVVEGHYHASPCKRRMSLASHLITEWIIDVTLRKDLLVAYTCLGDKENLLGTRITLASL